MKAADMGKIIEDKIRPTLNKLKDDTDMDVRYFAQMSLAAF